jgi:predicted membrane-bound spermidine synthase
VSIASQRVGIGLAALALGAGALLGQVLPLRELLVVFAGNELVLGVAFGLWLAGIAAGAAVGSRVVPRRAETLLTVVLVLLGPATVGAVVLARALRGFLSPEPGALLPLTSLLATAPAVVLPAAFLVGLAFPVACRVVDRERRAGAGAAGFVYVVEALGALVGGLGFTFLLAGRVPAVSSALLGGGLVAAGALGVGGRAGRPVRVLALLGLLASGGALASGLASGIEERTVRGRWAALAPGRRLLVSEETRYGVVEIGEREGQFDLYLSGGYASSFPDPWSSGPPAHLALASHPDPRSALAIGGGVDGSLQAMLRHPSLERLDHADLDPHAGELVRRHLPADLAAALVDPRLRFLGLDGRRVIREARAVYDVVLVDGPAPTSALRNRLYTVDFFRDVRAALRSGGVLVVRQPALPAYPSGEEAALQASVWRSLGEAFPARRLLAGAEGVFLLAAGSADILPDGPEDLGRHHARQGVADALFCPEGLDPVEVFLDLVEPRRSEEVLRALEARSDVPVNRDAHPVAILHALVLFDRFSGGGAAELFRRLAALPAWILPSTLVVPPLLVVGPGALRRRGRRARAAGTAIATTGFAAMALELALLLHLQSSLGHVYGLVGAVVATFMAGLAAGGYVGSRPSPRRTSLRLLETVVALAVLAGAFPFVLDRIGAWPTPLTEGGYLTLAAVAGGLTGRQFPLAVTWLLRAREPERLAGIAGGLDALDHAGAAVGAMLTGVILLPLLGVLGAATTAGALSVVAAAGLLLAGTPVDNQSRSG